MIKTNFKLIILISFVGFVTTAQEQYIGLSLKQIYSFLLWIVKYEEREKWNTDNPNWIKSQRSKPY